MVLDFYYVDIKIHRKLKIEFIIDLIIIYKKDGVVFL